MIWTATYTVDGKSITAILGHLNSTDAARMKAIQVGNRLGAESIDDVVMRVK